MLFTAEIAEIAKEFTAEDAETAEGSEVDVGRLGRLARLAGQPTSTFCALCELCGENVRPRSPRFLRLQKRIYSSSARSSFGAPVKPSSFQRRVRSS
jgi:hypothetical protein